VADGPKISEPGRGLRERHQWIGLDCAATGGFFAQCDARPDACRDIAPAREQGHAGEIRGLRVEVDGVRISDDAVDRNRRAARKRSELQVLGSRGAAHAPALEQPDTGTVRGVGCNRLNERAARIGQRDARIVLER